MKEALFYEKLEDEKVQCKLCPHLCILNEGLSGNCRVRTNKNGQLYSENYGKISGFHADPIEKKPLYHFFPGKKILSIGSVGCNLHCKFCQNYDISQSGIKDIITKELSPDSIVNDAMRMEDNIGIAYTYNEPLVFYEFMRDTALLAKQYKLKNVMVTNGYFEPEPLEKMLIFIDAFSLDLKAFTENFYKKMTLSGLEPVKRSLKTISRSKSFLEVTNLIIPGENDHIETFKEMIKWYAGELGENTVLHLSRYFPRYKLATPPTPTSKILELYNIASEHLNYVYLGNMITNKGSNTICPKCNKTLIEREAYHTKIIGLTKDGKCQNCSHSVIDYI